jgi:hypothetical protein
MIANPISWGSAILIAGFGFFPSLNTCQPAPNFTISNMAHPIHLAVAAQAAGAVRDLTTRHTKVLSTLSSNGTAAPFLA